MQKEEMGVERRKGGTKWLKGIREEGWPRGQRIGRGQPCGTRNESAESDKKMGGSAEHICVTNVRTQMRNDATKNEKTVLACSAQAACWQVRLRPPALWLAFQTICLF